METIKNELLKPLDIIQYAYALDKDTTYEVSISKPIKRRSLNANSYAWLLITKLANVLKISKEETYNIMLERYGVSFITPSLNEVIDISRYFDKYAVHERYIINNEIFITYKVLLGSSKYNSKEMTNFIDGIVQECKEQGIETMTPNELTNLLSQWQNQ